jgi:NAD(P)-dependent dehydrogenase (short-subunit alcohol dehydrogenase family)
MAPGAAIVTGAASGLGRELAAALIAAGWQTALVDLPESIDRVRELGIAADVAPRLVGLDVRDAGGWRNLHGDLRGAWPRLDLLVNCAGVGATGEVGTLPEAQWRRVLDTNLLGTALGCETFLPWLRANPGRSHVVNVASIAAILAPPSMAAYSASKAGVVALSEAIAAECPRGRPGVTVVCAGFFRSGLLDTWHFTGPVEHREAAGAPGHDGPRAGHLPAAAGQVNRRLAWVRVAHALSPDVHSGPPGLRSRGDGLAPR